MWRDEGKLSLQTKIQKSQTEITVLTSFWDFEIPLSFKMRTSRYNYQPARCIAACYLKIVVSQHENSQFDHSIKHFSLVTISFKPVALDTAGVSTWHSLLLRPLPISFFLNSQSKILLYCSAKFCPVSVSGRGVSINSFAMKGRRKCSVGKKTNFSGV